MGAGEHGGLGVAEVGGVGACRRLSSSGLTGGPRMRLRTGQSAGSREQACRQTQEEPRSVGSAAQTSRRRPWGSFSHSDSVCHVTTHKRGGQTPPEIRGGWNGPALLAEMETAQPVGSSRQCCRSLRPSRASASAPEKPRPSPANTGTGGSRVAAAPSRSAGAGGRSTAPTGATRRGLLASRATQKSPR